MTRRNEVTILILIDGFLQLLNSNDYINGVNTVTILILIDGFLQFYYNAYVVIRSKSHNPYFNRWFSAIS